MNYFEELKKFNYLIAIPSRDREFFLQKGNGVWRNFNRPPKEYPLILVVRKEEQEKYAKYYDGAFLFTKNDTDITETRQTILDYAIENGYKHLIMMDDDISLYYRDENLSSKYTQRLEDLHNNNVFDNIIFDALSITNEEYPLTGVPIKQASFACKYMFEKNRMIIRFVCYHLPTWKKENIHCSGLGEGVMEDYYVQLSLITKGYKTLSNCKWAVGDYATGYKGGCNATRTVEVQNASAKKLHELFPRHTILKVKRDGKQEWKDDRLDVSLRLKVDLKEQGELSYLPKEEVANKYGIKTS